MTARQHKHPPARISRYRIMQSEWPAKQAAYDPDWAPALKCAALDYVQVVRTYAEPRFFKVITDSKGAGILFHALEIWSETERMAPVWLPVRKVSASGKTLLFARHTRDFYADAALALDAACQAPLPKLTLDPKHLRWTRTFPTPYGAVGRGGFLDMPGGSNKLPAWLQKDAESGAWSINEKQIVKAVANEALDALEEGIAHA